MAPTQPQREHSVAAAALRADGERPQATANRMALIDKEKGGAWDWDAHFLRPKGAAWDIRVIKCQSNAQQACSEGVRLLKSSANGLLTGDSCASRQLSPPPRLRKLPLARSDEPGFTLPRWMHTHTPQIATPARLRRGDLFRS